MLLLPSAGAGAPIAVSPLRSSMPATAQTQQRCSTAVRRTAVNCSARQVDRKGSAQPQFRSLPQMALQRDAYGVGEEAYCQPQGAASAGAYCRRRSVAHTRAELRQQATLEVDVLPAAPPSFVHKQRGQRSCSRERKSDASTYCSHREASRAMRKDQAPISKFAESRSGSEYTPF